MMSDNPPPDYMKLYDNLRNQNEKLRQQVSELTEQKEGLTQALEKIQMVKASQLAEASEGEASINDSKMITNFVMDCLKARPKQVTVKYRGSIIIEIKPKL
jgi:cell division septum initiation protein DivIVA